MMHMHVPDMWANRGRYRTRPDGSLYPREQRRLREMMSRREGGAEPSLPPHEPEESSCGSSPGETGEE